MYDDSMKNTQGILSSNSYPLSFYRLEVERVPFRMAIGRSSDGCGIRAKDDSGIEDDSTRGPVGGRGRRV